MTEIVKVQKPIYSSDPKWPWLIYDKDRMHVEEIPDMLIPAHVKGAMNGSHKAYFFGEWSSVGGWEFSARVSDQQDF